MKAVGLLSWITLVQNVYCSDERRFPDEFIFGSATASYQIEGGWNADDKGENIWDHLTHTEPDVVKDWSNGDDAADSYHNYKRDVEMMRELGLDSYRFSLSWTRILPSGFPNYISEAGVSFYNNYINEMLKYNITPMATLYHWDLPQSLQLIGGFASPLIAIWFEDYARVAFKKFGDRVKHWITFNEPSEICSSYGGGGKAPRLDAKGIGDRLCEKNLLVAHARAYRAYKKDFEPSQKGVCGIALSIVDYKPATAYNYNATQLAKQAHWGTFADPIYSQNDRFPKRLTEAIVEKSDCTRDGYSSSCPTELTDEERELIRGTQDFLGINHYSAVLVHNSGLCQSEEWYSSAAHWLKQAPNSLYNVLMEVHNRYKDTVFYITENGWASYPGVMDDDDRIRYYRAALEDALTALQKGVNLKGYFAWSLMDNFEWLVGYTERFGLYAVDFDDPMRTRTPRKSAFVYKRIVSTRVIDPEYDPLNMSMTIDKGH